MPEITDRPVLAGVDGSQESLAALGLAASEAGIRNARLVVTHAWAGPPWRPRRAGAQPASRAEAERVLAAATGWLRTHHPDVAVTGRLVLGDPVEVLTAGSVTAQLVVVGHRGTGLARLGWGSVAAQLSRASKAPVIVRTVRAAGANHSIGGTVVVAVSSAPSSRTLRFAFEEAARFGVPLAPCYVWPGEAATAGTVAAGEDRHAVVDAAGTPVDDPAAAAAAPRTLARVLDGMAARYPQVDLRPEVCHGLDVAQTLAETAGRARLLVVGAGPANPLADLLTGSVSAGLQRIAGCPVAVVPEPMLPDPMLPDPMPPDPMPPDPMPPDPMPPTRSSSTPATAILR